MKAENVGKLKTGIIVVAMVLVAGGLLAATYTNTWIDGIFTGNGTLTTDIALPMWGVNQNATLQVSKNGTGDGGGQGSAIDAYAPGALGGPGGGGFIQRWWVDGAVDGGRVTAVSINYGGHMKMRTALTVSGISKDLNGDGPNSIPLEPTSDAYMIGTWNDVANGANMYSAANGYANEGDSNSQVFVAMDGKVVDAGIGEYHPNVRFAIDGNSGALRWTHSTANTYNAATWDAKFGRVAANILGDSTGTTSLQTYHLDQPSGKNEVAGTISIVAANNLSFAFVTAYAQAPICTISPRANPGGVTYWVTSTTATVKVNLSAVSTLSFNYICVGNPN
jgi:hypothetical protein